MEARVDDPQDGVGVPDATSFSPYRVDPRHPPAWQAFQLSDGYAHRLRRLTALVDLLAAHNGEAPLRAVATLGDMLRDEVDALRVLTRRAEQLLGVGGRS